MQLLGDVFIASRISIFLSSVKSGLGTWEKSDATNPFGSRLDFLYVLMGLGPRMKLKKTDYFIQKNVVGTPVLVQKIGM